MNRAYTLLAAAALFLVGSPARAQTCIVTPGAINLGNTLRLRCAEKPAKPATPPPADAAVTTPPSVITHARLHDKTIALFPQSDGALFGLMPVAVTETPGNAKIEFLDASGAIAQTLAVTIKPTRFPTQNVNLSPEIANLHTSTDEMAVLTAFRDAISDQRYWHDPLAPPVEGCVVSPFGVKRLHNNKPTGEYHGGVDQRVATGTPIRAIAAGVVKFAQPFAVLGNAVGVDHGQGLESMYLHMSKLVATPGATVAKGEILGYAGSTGRSTGPHLHWVIYVSSVQVNPAQWVTLAPCTRPTKKSR
jgi:murein DD-endopeptidase MepM/ murein hydrolase activator NlpD